MSVFVLDDLCLSLSSLPPNEAMVAVVSKDMMVECRLWYKQRAGEGGNRGNERSLGAVTSFVSRRIRDVVPVLARGTLADSSGT